MSLVIVRELPRKNFLKKSEHQPVLVALFFVERKALPFECLEGFRIRYPVFQQETGHFSPAHFGVNDYRGRLAVLVHLKFGRNDFHLTADTLPVQQVLHLTSSSCHPKIFIKEFCNFLVPCHQHCLRVNVLVQR